MKPFNLEQAKKGRETVTRDKRSARIISFNRKHDEYPIVALVMRDDGSEETVTYTAEGRVFSCSEDYPSDLLMKPIKSTYWVNLYWATNNQSGVCSSAMFDNEEDAIRAGNARVNYIKTIAVEREE